MTNALDCVDNATVAELAGEVADGATHVDHVKTGRKDGTPPWDEHGMCS